MPGAVHISRDFSDSGSSSASPGADTPARPLLTLGILANSTMENERRLPLHPHHLDRIDPEIRARMIVERGYAADFQLEPGYVESRVGRVADRAEVIRDADVLLLPKPQAGDVNEIPAGRTLWGWPHCVQDVELTQAAIDRRLTLIAFEAMNHWTRQGDFSLHVLHKNNELAGYCSVIHALGLTGTTGNYGPRRSAVVIGFGATARGGRHRAQRPRHPRHPGPHAARSDSRRIPDPQRAHHPALYRRWRSVSRLSAHRRRRCPAPDLPRSARHRRQLHTPGR